MDRLRLQFSEYEGFDARVWDVATPPPADLVDAGHDTVVCLNVLEHIEDHEAALRSMHAIVKKTGGRLVLLVPSYTSLFSDLDKGLGHYRRYERDELRRLCEAAGFEVETEFRFNLVGLLGWALNGRVLHRNRLPVRQLGMYEMIAPLTIPVERRLTLPVGLSLVVVARARPDA
jgi:SAM-dependent methyltransferase